MEKLSFKLDTFEGPLDLLLHLISKNKVNIYDIPIAEILSQYLKYLDSMKSMDLEVTADFLAMASQLIYIKSKMLLPVHEDEEEEDPRDTLVRLLLEYKKYKEAASKLAGMSDPFNNTFIKAAEETEPELTYNNTHSASELYDAYLNAVKRIKRRLPPLASSFRGIVGRTIVSVSEKAIFVLRRLFKKGAVPFDSLFYTAKSRSEIVATFLAVLELAKNRRICVDDGKIRLDDSIKKKGKGNEY